jgi:hypothetical protein
VQWAAVRKTVGEIRVPEQMGKIRPSLVRCTMNAPTLGKLRSSSMKP